MPTNPCATCRHWHGDASRYLADCAINGTATAFDAGCGAWAGRETKPTGGVFITSGPTSLLIGPANATDAECAAALARRDEIRAEAKTAIERIKLGTLKITLPDMSKAFSRFSQSALDAARAMERAQGAIQIRYTPTSLAYELNGFSGVGSLGVLSPSEIDALYGGINEPKEESEPMSYNVDNFDVRELREFTLPFAAVMELTEGSQTLQGDTYTFDEFDVEAMEIIGTRQDDRLIVTELHYHGEFSGTFWDDFAKLLKQSTGYLKALVVWEGGDTVEWLTIENGELKTEQL